MSSAAAGWPKGRRSAAAGKRAAFALFYGPLHFLIVDHVVRALPAARKHVKTLVDVGCGTGAAGAAWSAAASRAPDLVVGVDRNQWALTEATWTYRQFGLRSRMQQDDAARAPLPKSPAAFLAAFTLNELPDASRVRAAAAAARSWPRR